MKRILIMIVASVLGSLPAAAQPAKRRTAPVGSPANAPVPSQAAAGKKPDRATLMFPTAAEMPEDVVWRRDVYRQLNLLKDANAPLYYPVEPRGKDQNLFTFLLRLFVSGRISAYKYNLDGYESFDAANKLQVKDVLENFSIHYEEKDGKISVAASDIPSASVKSFYIKESSYFDQRSATYKARVVALCPVLLEEDLFGTIDEASPDDEGSPSAISKPMFWVRYDDVASYLSRLPLMASNLNNVANMTADDYFTMNRYDGQIYMTNNLQGRTIPTDSTRTSEQKRVEQQLKDFEEAIWHAPAAAKDSLGEAAAAPADAASGGSKAAKSRREQKGAEAESRRSKSSAAAAAGKRQKSSGAAGGSSAPRVSARRQRR